MPKVGEKLEGHSVLSRIFDIRTGTPYACMVKNGDPYDEFNIFLGMIKTGLTGEYNFGDVNRYITGFAWLLFISGTFLFILDIILFFRLFTGDFIKSVPIRLFWVILVMTGILFMLRLMFTVPNFSSEDLRYIAWLILPAAMLPGMYLCGDNKGSVRFIIFAGAGVFILSSAAVYYLLGKP